MLRQRLLSAALLLPLLLAVLWFGGPPGFAGVVTAAAVLGVDELYRLARGAGIVPLRWAGLAFTVVLLWLPKIGPDPRWGIVYAVFALLSLPILLAPASAAINPQRLARLWTVGGALYLAWPLSAALLLRDVPHGREWVLMLLIVAFSVDTGAYAVGRALGRRPLAPRISPNKTQEGALGGLIAGVVASMLAVALFDLPLSLLEAAVWGFVLAIVAQIGDLYESAIKRRLDTKEASSLIPGHGGLLDRLDSVLASSLVLYYLVLWRTLPVV